MLELCYPFSILPRRPNFNVVSAARISKARVYITDALLRVVDLLKHPSFYKTNYPPYLKTWNEELHKSHYRTVCNTLGCSYPYPVQVSFCNGCSPILISLGSIVAICFITQLPLFGFIVCTVVGLIFADRSLIPSLRNLATSHLALKIVEDNKLLQTVRSTDSAFYDKNRHHILYNVLWVGFHLQCLSLICNTTFFSRRNKDFLYFKVITTSQQQQNNNFLRVCVASGLPTVNNR